MARPAATYFDTGRRVLHATVPEKSQDIGENVKSAGVGVKMGRLLPHVAISVMVVALCLAEHQGNQPRGEEGCRYIFTLTRVTSGCIDCSTN